MPAHLAWRNPEIIPNLPAQAGAGINKGYLMIHLNIKTDHSHSGVTCKSSILGL